MKSNTKEEQGRLTVSHAQQQKQSSQQLKTGKLLLTTATRWTKVIFKSRLLEELLFPTDLGLKEAQLLACYFILKL